MQDYYKLSEELYEVKIAHFLCFVSLSILWHDYNLLVKNKSSYADGYTQKVRKKGSATARYSSQKVINNSSLGSMKCKRAFPHVGPFNGIALVSALLSPSFISANEMVHKSQKLGEPKRKGIVPTVV